MSHSLIFVHGTGVRADSFTKTFEVVRSAVMTMQPTWNVRPCFWGLAEGAKLSMGGASIPRYDHTGGGKVVDEELAIWALLYQDPGYELRLLGLRPRPGSGLAVGVPPTRAFLDFVHDYQPSANLRAAFAAHGLEEAFQQGLRTVIHSSEVNDAASTVDTNGYEHRHAVARAVVAATLATAHAEGADAISGTARDALLNELGTELRAKARSLPGKAAAALARFACKGFTWHAIRHRGAAGDGLVPMVGDILRYQARGAGIRDLIQRSIEHAPGKSVTLLAHSLGGVACVDLLARNDLPRVECLITVGSQASFLYELGALVSLENQEALSANFPKRWLNIYDLADLLSFRAEGVLPYARDCQVDNGQPFPYSHSAYWANDEVWKAIASC